MPRMGAQWTGRAPTRTAGGAPFAAAAAVIAASVIAPPRAAATTPRPAARLVYARPSEPAGCPDEAAVRDAVSSRLGYFPFDSRADRTVRARITSAGAGAGLRAEVALVAPNGEVTGGRQLSTPTGDCAELASAMELAISIAIDPLVVTRATPTAPAPAGPRPAPAPPPAPVAVTPAVVAVSAGAPVDAASPAALRAGIDVLGSVGSAPAPALGISAEVGLRWGRGSVALVARADLPATRDDGSGRGGVQSSLLLASVVPCVHHGIALVCAIAAAGALQGSGVDVPDPQHATTAYLAGGARLGAELPLAGPLALRIRLEVLATPTRTALRIDGRDRWVTPTLSGNLGAGVVGTFP